MINDFNDIQCTGLYDGAIVSCRVVDDLPTLDTVYVTATNQKDWEILVSNYLLLATTINAKCLYHDLKKLFLTQKEASSYRIQNTLLDQTRIINEDKNLIVWINSAIHITLKIGIFLYFKNVEKLL